MLDILTTMAIALKISTPGLLPSICWVESNYRNVINEFDGGSPSYGICQIKLNTANWMKEYHKITGPVLDETDLMEPKINTLYAGLYIKYQLNRYNGDIECAISAYNAGRCIKGNKKYVKKVLKRLNEKK